MKNRNLFLLILVAATAMALQACKKTEPGEAAGAEANSGKSYSAEEAAAAQPKRGNSER